MKEHQKKMPGFRPGGGTVPAGEASTIVTPVATVTVTGRPALVAPYLIFAALWVAAALVPTFAGGLLFNWTADLIAIVALLGTARFFLALAGLDVGTSFGGIGSSREMMIASLAEPAMLMMVFTLSLLAGATQLSAVAHFMLTAEVGLRVSLGLAPPNT